MVNSFFYSYSIINALERSLSTERLSTYLAAANSDHAAALRLYVWNTQISAALRLDPLPHTVPELRGCCGAWCGRVRPIPRMSSPGRCGGGVTSSAPAAAIGSDECVAINSGCSTSDHQPFE